MRFLALALLVTAPGCHLLFGLQDVDLDKDARVDDGAGLDARVRFGAPRRVQAPVGGGEYANDVTLTADQKELIYARYMLPPHTLAGATVAKGATVNDPTSWPQSSPLGIANVRVPKVSPDGLLLFVAQSNDLHAYRRATRMDPWLEVPAELAGMPTTATTDQERPGTITADALQMVMYRRTGGEAYELWLYTRQAPNAPWTDASALLGVIHATHPAPMYSTLGPHLTADGLTLVYSMNTHQTLGPADLWIADRGSVTDPFGAPRKILEVSDSELGEGDPWLAPDRSALYFSRSADNSALRQSEWGIYVSAIEAF